ncbi:hypothetical protein MBO12_04300 [Candidatus Saccharibacteria bacterium]|nr:hypothetical protein [Candidatus Saccharibacteria bacterium]
MNQTKIVLKKIETGSQYDRKTVLALIASVQTVYRSQYTDYLASYSHDRRIQPAPARNLRPSAHGVYATVARRRIVVGELDFLRQSKIKGLPNDTQAQPALGVAVNGRLAGVVYFDHQSVRRTSPHKLKLIIVIILAMTLIALSYFAFKWF